MPNTFFTEQDPEIHAREAQHGDVRARLALQMIKQVRDSLNHVIALLEEGDTPKAAQHMLDFVSHKKIAQRELEETTGSRILEGVFDGQSMIGADGVRYPVPENYASKSKLVEGDVLKLTIRPDGSFLFKQIGPIERKRIVGTFSLDASTQEPVVVCSDGVYKVLAASISYHKVIPGDTLIVVIPSGGFCRWAAVERIE